MRAPGRRVGLCRRSTRLGAPGAAPSHPVLAVRPSCGLLKCNTVSFVSHRHTAINAARFQLLLYQFTVTIELFPHWDIEDTFDICHSRSQSEGTPLTPIPKYIPPLVSNVQDTVTTQKMCLSVCYKLNAGPVEC